jgi:hypothetical protein
VTAIEFLAPFPILCSVSSDGCLCFFGVRPDLSFKYRLFDKFTLESQMEPVPITQMKKFYLDKDDWMPNLVLGDDKGNLFTLES